MVKISQINFGKVDYTKSKQTTRVPKEQIQTFQTNKKTDYTTITKENTYATKISDLNTKFENIKNEKYILEAKNNGFKTLIVSDEDYANFGTKWDEIPA